MFRIIKVISLISFSASILFAQANRELGYPQIKNYSPKEYGAHAQNWSIIQDNRGIMYFGNVGVLEYDGFDWRLIPLTNNSTARSFGIDSNGRIYVGGVGDLGYLEPNLEGEMKFISLLNKIPNEFRNFADVWNLYVNGDEIFYTTDAYVFRFSTHDQNIKVWKATNTFHVSFLVGGNFYIREWQNGLLKLENDSLKLLPGGDRFANERIYVMLKMPKSDELLLVTRNEGVFIYDGKEFKQFKTEADDFLKKNLIYMPGLVLQDGNIALGTITGGLIIIDQKGKIVNVFNTQSGLRGNTIYYLYQDHSGSIWVGLDGGITKLDYGSAATYFDARKGLDQTPYKLVRHNGILYAATNSGIYYLNPVTSLFSPIKDGPVTQCFDLISFDHQLIAGTNEGVYKIEYDKAIPIRKSINKDYEVGLIFRSKINPNRLFIAVYGVGSLLFENGKWIDEGMVPGLNFQCTSIIEKSNGDLWIGTIVKGVYNLSFDKSEKGDILINKPQIEFFDETYGLPPGQNLIYNISGEYYFVFPDGLYRFDEFKKHFYKDSTFNIVPTLNSNYSGFFILQDSTKKIWITGGLEPAFGIPQVDESYKWIKSPFKRFSDELINSIYPDKDSIVWFNSNYGSIRYDLKINKNLSEGFSSLLRKIIVGQDSVLYMGGFEKQNFIPDINFEDNSIKFLFSSTSFEDETRNLYRTFLDGFDENWSHWNKEHIKEYTNLPPGEYNFRIKSKNILEVESNEASFSFRILSPWYRTIWAYAGYIIVLAFVIYSVDRYQRRRLTLKERQRARLRETELRMQTAEATAKVLQAENERKKNIELLSEIGKDITANLTIGQIIDIVYENVNSLMDAAVFGIGIYEEKTNRIFFPGTKEKGVSLNSFYNNVNDENRPAAWCFRNQKEIFTTDYLVEHKKYIKEIKSPVAGEHTQSIIYIPLTYKGKKMGVITAQSFKKDAYTDYHLNILRNLATYTAIAIDNADAYRQLNETVSKLDLAIKDLKATQEKLIVQQKLASLGQLTAGIAHEIKNPLNFVNNFAQLSNELVNELREEFEKERSNLNSNFVNNIEDILSNIEQNVTKINEHGTRADSIVRSMLQHSRGKSGEKLPSDINSILDEDLNLAYHGMRAQNSEFNISIEKKYDEKIGKINIVQQEVSRVFLNIIQNGFYETHKKKTINGKDYSPIISVKTKNAGDKVEIRIRDNGNGVPSEIRDKLFEPFFTTKPTGQGTGLGLSLSYDIIVKQHSGEIKFESELGEFTEFIVTLPKE